jgi:hypothetical protein
MSRKKHVPLLLSTIFTHISLSLNNIWSNTLHADYDFLDNFFTFFLKIWRLAKAGTRLSIKHWMR